MSRVFRLEWHTPKPNLSSYLYQWAGTYTSSQIFVCHVMPSDLSYRTQCGLVERHRTHIRISCFDACDTFICQMAQFWVNRCYSWWVHTYKSCKLYKFREFGFHPRQATFLKLRWCVSHSRQAGTE